jgi:hypothetical protein
MLSRIRKMTLALAALAALAFGGAAIAQGAGNGQHAQKGAATHDSAKTSQTQPVDPDTTQSGDQSAPDGQETSGEESPGSEVPGNDGPSGHADEPGAPAANHEATGVE